MGSFLFNKVTEGRGKAPDERRKTNGRLHWKVRLHTVTHVMVCRIRQEYEDSVDRLRNTEVNYEVQIIAKCRMFSRRRTKKAKEDGYGTSV